MCDNLLFEIKIYSRRVDLQPISIQPFPLHFYFDWQRTGYQDYYAHIIKIEWNNSAQTEAYVSNFSNEQ